MKFESPIYRPIESKNAQPDEQQWGFVLVPLAVSETFSRRGRMYAEVTCGGEPHQVLLEPDGKKSHWFWLPKSICRALDVDLRTNAGGSGLFEFFIEVSEPQPEPPVPEDFWRQLQANTDALATWHNTTTIARIDWLHWITTAKQEKTRTKRILDGCDMLASGKKRVCCFDTSGVFSKALSHLPRRFKRPEIDRLDTLLTFVWPFVATAIGFLGRRRLWLCTAIARQNCQ